MISWFIDQMDFARHHSLCQCAHCIARRKAIDAAVEAARPHESFPARDEDGVIVRGPQS